MRTFFLYLACLMLAACASAQTQYTLFDLGESDVARVDAGGIGVGHVQNQAALLTATEPPHRLGFLPQGTRSEARAADQGRVVGVSGTGQYSSITHAFVWKDGSMADQGTLGAPDLYSSLNGISGTLGVGTCETRLAFVACVFDLASGGVQALPTLGGPEGRGMALNTKGAMVGVAQTGTGLWHATLWQAGAHIDMTPGATESLAMDINESGLVVGTQDRQGFLWTKGGGLQVLSPFPGDGVSQLEAVNAAGVAVGSSRGEPKEPPAPMRAIRVLAGSTTPEDLNTLTTLPAGWHLQRASGISAAGVIGGLGTVNGTEHAWLLIPR